MQTTFLLNENNHPIGCVAFMYTDGHVLYNFSVLNPADEFDRKFAKHLAIGRAVESPRGFPAKTNPGTHGMIKAVFRDMLRSGGVPSKAHRSVKRWLKAHSK